MIPLMAKEHGTHTKTAISQEKQLKKMPFAQCGFCNTLTGKDLKQEGLAGKDKSLFGLRTDVGHDLRFAQLV